MKFLSLRYTQESVRKSLGGNPKINADLLPRPKPRQTLIKRRSVMLLTYSEYSSDSFTTYGISSVSMNYYGQWIQNDTLTRPMRPSTSQSASGGNLSRAYSIICVICQWSWTNPGISCQRCHSHKIKCSGDQPCVKCRLVGCADECHYVPRDRQVKVSERYDQVFKKLKIDPNRATMSLAI